MATKKPAGIGLAVPTISNDEAQYRARDDMETLRRAEEIKMDRQRHGAAKKAAGTHLKALQRIRGK